MNQSIHMVDMLCDLMPPIESVQAYTATLGHTMETEDTAVAALRYKTGALGVIYGTTASFPGQFRRFEITGTKGTVINVENSITVWQFADERPEDEQVRQKFMKIQGGGGVADPAAITHENHTRNFKAFLDALETGKDFWISGPEARKAVEVILAIYRSAKEKKMVKLAERVLRKFEARNPKSETNPKSKAPMTETLAPVGGPVLSFGFWTFEFVSDFGFVRISCFEV